MVAALCLELDWPVVLVFVPLLYAHEIGHALAAVWRGLQVRGAPVFIPGFGAFVQTEPRTRPWDEVCVVLGGPALGSLAAVATKLLARDVNSLAMAQGADLALIVNLINLAPVSPLDGGKLSALLGAGGFVLTLLAIPVVLSRLVTGPLVLVLVVFGLLLGVRSVRRPAFDVSAGTRVDILTVYAAAVVVVLVFWITSGYVQPAHFRSLFGASITDVAVIIVGVVLGSGFAVRYAFRSNCPAPLRYVLLGPLGWPWLLFKRSIALVLSGWVALAIVASLPGATGWLRSVAMVWSRQHWPGVGVIVAIGYDALRWRMGAEAGEAWLEYGTSLVAGAGVPGLESAGSYLFWLGHSKRMVEWISGAVERHCVPEPVGSWIANNYAWYCYLSGRAATGLPYAREAVAATPDQWAYLGTLRRLLIDVGEPDEAVEVLQRSLVANPQPRTRIALARALAARGDFDEAIQQANQGLTEHGEPWPADEPNRTQVQSWIVEWQAAT